ncbi:MAG: hypothetical protein EBX52_04285 [Proteobacteria bacterium]|nr:hypothetical protein [Pseudomonadota bacterium]
MKNLIFVLTGLLSLSTLARAESRLEYSADFEISTGEKKSLTLRISPILSISGHGEPEIPSHGFYDYEVQGTVIENGTSCPFSVLLFQQNGPKMSTEQVLSGGIDRSETFQTCSKLSVKIASVRALLNRADSTVSLFASGLRLPLAKATLHFTRVYQEPVSTSSDPWHDY